MPGEDDGGSHAGHAEDGHGYLPHFRADFLPERGFAARDSCQVRFVDKDVDIAKRSESGLRVVGFGEDWAFQHDYRNLHRV